MAGFSQLKETLWKAPLLLYLDSSKTHVVVNNASDLAAMEVIMQDQCKGGRPLAFMNPDLKPTKQRYSA